MKTKSIFLTFFLSLFAGALFAQDRTTVTATSNDISDNLDLRAVASIFGDSNNLEDFERRLNDPKTQISNLDLNRDNQVDYLRVIESVEGNTNLIIIQSVLDKDVFQDIATVEVERGSNNEVQVQVVGDVYMYGPNYIYEPVYVSRPYIYDYFWVAGYHPYYSSWYWGYYPTYYYAWAPYPIFRYRNHIHDHINVHHHYNYVTVRRSQRAYAMASNYRANGYEVRNPNHSFRQRNANVNNRYELDQVRNTGTRGNNSAAINNTETPRNTAAGNIRNNAAPKNTGTNTEGLDNVRTQTGATRANTTPGIAPTQYEADNNVRNNNTNSTVSPRTAPRTKTPSATVQADEPRTQPSVRTETTSPRATTTPRAESPRVESPRAESPRAESPRAASPRAEAPRAESPRVSTRSESPRISASPQGQINNAPRENRSSGAPSGNGNRGGRR